MIESIQISRTATYGDAPQALTDLKMFTYIYGSNGSGKTTISRIIANVADTVHSGCRIVWKGGSPLEVMVYNRDFVQSNFGEAAIKGVFTLGKQSVEEVESLRLAAVEVTKRAADIVNFKATLEGPDGFGGKRGELAALDNWLQEKCWIQKVKHGIRLSDAFDGYRNDKSRFKRKILEELALPSGAEKPTLAELESRAETVFGLAPTAETLLPLPSLSSLTSHESDLILPKVVVGSKDVDIAAMIAKLGNSDWVKQGRPFFQNNDGDCPFCQQTVPLSLETSLEEYFDGAYVADTDAIDALALAYEADGKTFLAAVDAVIASTSGRLDKTVLEAQRNIAAAKIAANSVLIDSKRKEPSTPIVTFRSNLGTGYHPIRG